MRSEVRLLPRHHTLPLLYPAFQIEDREQEKPRPEYIGKLLGIKPLSGQRDKDLLQIVQKTESWISLFPSSRSSSCTPNRPIPAKLHPSAEETVPRITMG